MLALLTCRPSSLCSLTALSKSLIFSAITHLDVFLTLLLTGKYSVSLWLEFPFTTLVSTLTVFSKRGGDSGRSIFGLFNSSLKYSVNLWLSAARAAARAARDRALCPFVMFVNPLLVFNGLDLSSIFFEGGSVFTSTFSVLDWVAAIIL